VKRGKILVIRGGAIGDFILTLPAIAALRNQFPNAHLEVLGYPHIVQLAQAGGLVDRVQSIQARALAGFFARKGALDENLSEYFSEFDIIVSYLFDPDLIFQTNVKLCTSAQFIVGPHRPNEAEKTHATQVYLKPLERLAIFDADNFPRLHIGPRSLNSVGTSRLAVHPGSGSEKKNWPEKNWAELLRRLTESTQLDLLLVGGEAEGDLLQRLAAQLPPARIHVAQSLPLAELAEQLQQCAAFIGHDSGVSHLAAALGLPGVILWGDTTEEIWRPPHETISVLKKNGGLKQIGVEEVIGELKRLMKVN
jgi:heptosyltransferase-3